MPKGRSFFFCLRSVAVLCWGKRRGQGQIVGCNVCCARVDNIACARSVTVSFSTYALTATPEETFFVLQAPRSEDDHPPVRLLVLFLVWVLSGAKRCVRAKEWRGRAPEGTCDFSRIVMQ